MKDTLITIMTAFVAVTVMYSCSRNVWTPEQKQDFTRRALYNATVQDVLETVK